MALDLYQPCPCHQQRKLKFCCGKDVVARIGKAIELMEGEQRRKAMDYLNESIKKFGHKDCLSTMRFGAAMDTGDIITATETANQYGEENGPTSVGYSMMAILSLESDLTEYAIECLQSALEADDQMANLFEDALLTLIFRLFTQKEIQAVRAHAYLLTQISLEKKDVGQTIINKCMQSDAPLVLKHDWPLVEPTSDQPWAKQAAQAIHWARKWQWARAMESMLELAEEHKDEPSLWKNTAILAGYLNKKQIAADAWRKYAGCEGVHPDHAEEAEQMAIYLSDWEGAEKIPAQVVRGDINDLDSLYNTLEKEPCFHNNQQALKGANQGDSDPAIKHCFVLLDKPFVPSADQISEHSQVPKVAGNLFIFGKTTDQPSQFEFIGFSEEAATTCLQTLQSTGFVENAEQSVEEAEQTPSIIDKVEWRWFPPQNTDEETIINWCEAAWEDKLENEFPSMTSSLLDGDSFQEAAKKPHLLPRVKAILSILDNQSGLSFDKTQGLEKLRQALEIDAPESIDPESISLDDTSLCQFARLDFAKMPNDMLAWAFEVASTTVNTKAIESISQVITGRLDENEEEVTATFPVFQIYQILAKLSPRVSVSEQNLELAEKYFPEDADLKMQADWLMSSFEVAVSRHMFDKAIDYLQRASEVCKQDEELHLEFVKTCSRLGIHPSNPMPGAAQKENPRSIITDPSSVSQEPASGSKPSPLWIPGQ